MPTRKQRRRRQKELRHEYEYVYVDGEGREVEVDPDELEDASPHRNGKRETKAAPAKGRSGKPVREVQPPSWNRVLKRAVWIAPLLFLALSALNRHQARTSHAARPSGLRPPSWSRWARAWPRRGRRRSGPRAPTRRSRKA